jgi:uncharacterized protein YjbI with pentapeptide repeats
MTDAILLPEEPYRGIEPFRYVDNPIFYGRAAETERLVRQVALYRGVLLYGESGVGKSSLINAGFIPAISRNGYIPERIRVQPRRSQEIVIERIRSNTGEVPSYLPSILVHDDSSGQVVFSIDAFKTAVQQIRRKPYCLLIFDQFEELISLFEETSAAAQQRDRLQIQERLLALIIGLTRDQSLPLKLLFVFREDYLAKLAKLFLECPQLPDQYLRLTLPGSSSVADIVRGPFKTQLLRRHFRKTLSTAMSKKLITAIRDRGRGGDLTLSEVQVVCLELWRAADPDALFARRGLAGLVEDFMNGAINQLARENLADAAVALLSRMITHSGTRNIVAKEELIGRVGEEDNISEETLKLALDALESRTRLVRRELRHGAYFYEIVSEFLIPWIKERAVERLSDRKQMLTEDAGRRRSSRVLATSPRRDTVAAHLAILRQGRVAWTEWRRSDATTPDLRGADLRGLNLAEWNFDGALMEAADLTECTLNSATFRQSDLRHADFTRAAAKRAVFVGANLTGAFLGSAMAAESSFEGATLTESNLARAALNGALLRNADLRRADLRQADLSGARLERADLTYASMVETNLDRAIVVDCLVYGISAWNLRSDQTLQRNLIITRPGETTMTVDSLEVAQFLYTILNSARLRGVIDNITSKIVLILGRFTPERMMVLDAIRDGLRQRDYLPVLFDFDKPSSKSSIETISTLAHMARFIIADLTDPSSVPHELATLAPSMVVPVQSILVEGQREYAMFHDLVRRYHWVLEPYQYKSPQLLLEQLNERVIAPAEAKAKELTQK